MVNPSQARGDTLAEWRVLVLLTPSKKERTKYLVSLLEAAKARWGWQISGICEDIDRRPFAPLVEPEGKLISRPHLLRIAAWESDPEQVTDTQRRLQEAESAAGISAGRIILAGAHSAGRAYNVPFRHANRFPLVMRMLKDNREPARLVRRLFRFADESLALVKPDLVIANEWATPLNFTMWMAAKRRGIRCVSLRNSKINADHGFWTADQLMFNTAATAAAAARRKNNTVASEAAKRQISEFRDQPAVINYIAARWRHRKGRGFVRWHVDYMRAFAREFVNTFRGQDTALREPWIGRLLRYYRFEFLTCYHQRFFNSFDNETLSGMKYFYFPMHKEAELAQTFQSTLWHDQRNTIRVLASMLPAGYRLLMREHRMNYGHRPTRFYKEISQIPNLIMIDPFDSQFKYLHHADLTVTENGSSGWEALLMGRRVITLAKTFYDGAGSCVKVLKPGELNAVILELLAGPAVADPGARDHALGCMIDAERETTFSLNPDQMPDAIVHLERAVLHAGSPAC